MTQYSDTLFGGIAPTAPRQLRAVIAVVGGAALIALASRIQVPMWPVPMTMQTLAMLVVVMTLGQRLALGAVLGYLGAGAAGLPVFAAGGGIVYLTGPTAGYLLGFVVTAWIVGALADRGLTRRPLGALALALLGSVIVYACGVVWLSGFVGFETALRVGVVPFVPGDLLKALVIALGLPAAMRLMVRAG